jgi:Ras-related protein Rab-1A
MVCHSDKYDYLFNICLVGDSGVGKTGLFQRYAVGDSFRSCLPHAGECLTILHGFQHRRFDTIVPTIGIDFCVHTVEVDGKKVKLRIHDTAGQERFRSLARQYYRGADAILLVYDITDRLSFAGLTGWLKDIKAQSSESCWIQIAGNKCDLEASRSVSVEEAQYYASALGVGTTDVSAKTSENVDATLTSMVRELMRIENNRRAKTSATGIRNIARERLTIGDSPRKSNGPFGKFGGSCCT